LQLKIDEKIAFILIGRAWIPAPSTLLRTSFAGMTRSGNRQSINRIGIILDLPEVSWSLTGSIGQFG